MPYAPINGLNLYYEKMGAPNAKNIPLILLHGGGSTLHTSFGLSLQFLAKDRQVIAYDRKGHGRTSDDDQPFTIKGSVKDCITLLKYLGIERADFWGYSAGGHVAIQLALNHPGIVNNLIVESSMFTRDGSDPPFWEMFNHVKVSDMPPELRQEYLDVAPDPDHFEQYFYKGVQLMKDFAGWSDLEIQSIAAPTLLLIGDKDIVIPEHAKRIVGLIRKSQLMVLSNTDHMQMVNRSEDTLVKINHFLESTNAAS